MTRPELSARQQQILDYILNTVSERGYPPAVREIGEAVGLSSPSTVHSHLSSLVKAGYIRRDPTKPRAIEVTWDPNSGVAMERRPVRHVPLVGDVAAGTDVLAQENVEELLPLPADFTGDGELFMLRVRGESMIDAGILDGDFVIAVQQNTAERGDIVVAAVGRPDTVTADMVKPGAVVVDVGINRIDDPTTEKGSRLVGDVDFEALQDVARNLARYCHVIVARTFDHELVVGLARHADIPVVNALTDDLHPCQAMADALTMREHGDLRQDLRPRRTSTCRG